MKKIALYLFTLLLACGAASCQKADSEKSWGSSLIYMPQANYHPYAVPNGGSEQQTNRNYSIDRAEGKVKIFLGVYRAGLAELEDYAVSVSVGTTPLDGTTLLPAGEYALPQTVYCPSGRRDATFYLTVDLAFLSMNSSTDFSLPVTISDPTRYTLNEQLVTTQIRINTAELLSKEGL